MTTYSLKAKNRIVIAVMLVTVLILAILHLTLNYLTRNVVERHMVHTVQGVATAVARAIELDLERYMAFVHSEDRDIDSAYYLEMNAFFAEIKRAGALAYVYTVSPKEDGEFEYILDGEPIGSANWSAPGDYNAWDIGKENVLAGNATFGHGLMEQSEEWGALIVAYAPIRNSNGDLMGMVGVDISGEYFYSYINRIQIILFILYAIIVLIVWLLAKYFSSAIVEVMFKDKLTNAYTKRHYESLIHPVYGKPSRMGRTYTKLRSIGI